MTQSLPSPSAPRAELDKTPSGTPASESARPAGGTSETTAARLPEGVLPVLPLRSAVLFPTLVMPLSVGREKSLAAVQHAVRTQSPIAVILQRNPEENEPQAADLYEIGTVGNVVRYVTAADGSHHLISRGEYRFRIVEFVSGYPFVAARVEKIAEPEAKGSEVEARFVQLKERAAANRRSVQAEVKEITERVAREKTFEQLQQQLENFSKRFRRRKMTDTLKLVREDRGR